MPRKSRKQIIEEKSLERLRAGIRNAPDAMGRFLSWLLASLEDGESWQDIKSGAEYHKRIIRENVVDGILAACETTMGLESKGLTENDIHRAHAMLDCIMSKRITIK